MAGHNNHNFPDAPRLFADSNFEALRLAPRPTPTFFAPYSDRKLRQSANEVFMDYAISFSVSSEFALRCSIGSIMSVIIFFFLVGLGLGIVDYLAYGDAPFEIVLTLVLPNGFVWGFVTLLTLLYGYLLFRAVYQQPVIPPIRFNRQRREVAYVARRGEAPRIVSWEKIIANVSNEQMHTEHGVLNHIALKIGLQDEADGQIVWLAVPSASPQSAISEWEAIRVYMEEGPAALPAPLMAGMPDEGTVAFFHACRRNYRERHGYVRYLFGFLLIQFFSGWTLPNHIAHWVEQLPKTGFPKAVREWSKPLPREQWATPSAELLEESEAVRRSFRKGIDMFRYFSAKRPETPR